jgi:hypothetical protein
MTNDKLVAERGEMSTILWPIVDRHELVARFRPREIPRQAGFKHYELGDDK